MCTSDPWSLPGERVKVMHIITGVFTFKTWRLVLPFLFWKWSFPPGSALIPSSVVSVRSRPGLGPTSSPHGFPLSITGTWWFNFSRLSALINHQQHVSREVFVKCKKGNTVWPACECTVAVLCPHELYIYNAPKYVFLWLSCGCILVLPFLPNQSGRV